MDVQFVGHHVSINCGLKLGFFQGSIDALDTQGQTITISNPYKNGIKCDGSQITINARDIVDLTILNELSEESSNKNTAKSNTTTGPASTTVDGSQNNSASNVSTRKHNPKGMVKSQEAFSPQISSPKIPHSFREQRHPLVRDGRSQVYGNARQRMDFYNHSDDCFTIDHSELSTDFDFEKNLALFDKQALTPGKARKQKTPAKYRHDENVIESKPVVYRQIITAKTQKAEVAEYYTDAGLVVPCISSSMRQSISCAAEKLGISFPRQVEAFALNGSQMVLSLLGGSNRFHPRNAHQRPHVVIFTAPHQLGAHGIAIARHLAAQSLHIDLFLANFVKMHDYLQEELKLLALTSAQIINDAKDLPTTPVDLVIVAMDDDSSSFFRQHPWYKAAISWCNNNMAPVMCLCPPGDKESMSDLNVKWSVYSGLPLSLPQSFGLPYLIDIGLPPKVFEQTGIKYRSPFCSKPYIALHRSR